MKYTNPLVAVIVPSPIPHGYVWITNKSEIRRLPGVRAILTYESLPGLNKLDDHGPSPPILSSKVVNYVGEPIGLIVAETPSRATEALASVQFRLEPFPEIKTIEAACNKGMLFGFPRIIESGLVQQKWARDPNVFHGKLHLRGQPLSTLGISPITAFPEPILRIEGPFSSIGLLQQRVMNVLRMPFPKVRICATHWIPASHHEESLHHLAILAAAAAQNLNRSVSVSIDPSRHHWVTPSCNIDYRISIGRDEKIRAFEATFRINLGAYSLYPEELASDILLHLTGPYDIKNVRGFVVGCRTHQPPRIASNETGAFFASMALEAAISEAKEGHPLMLIQQRNLMSDGEPLPFGQPVKRCNGIYFWNAMVRHQKEDWRVESTKARAQSNTGIYTGVGTVPIRAGYPITGRRETSSWASILLTEDGDFVVRLPFIDPRYFEKEKLRNLVQSILKVEASPILFEVAESPQASEYSHHNHAYEGLDIRAKALGAAAARLYERLSAMAKRKFGLHRDRDIRFIEGQIWSGEHKTEIALFHLAHAAREANKTLLNHEYLERGDLRYRIGLESGRPFPYWVYGAATSQVSFNAATGDIWLNYIRLVHDPGPGPDPAFDRIEILRAIRQGISRIFGDACLSLSPSGSTLEDWIDLRDEGIAREPEPNGFAGRKILGNIPSLAVLSIHHALNDALGKAGVDPSGLRQFPIQRPELLSAILKND